MRLDADGIVIFRDVRAHLAQLCGDAVQMLGNDVFDEDVAADGRGSGHIGAGLDLVRDDGVACRRAASPRRAP